METNLFVTTILPISLAVIMFGMGTTLTRSDFEPLIEKPKAVLLGLIGQLILLPCLGFILTFIFELSAEDSVGIMILTACAGGPVSNLVCYFIKADVALSVSLTALSCLITIFSIPWIVNWSLLYFLGTTENTSLPIGKTNLILFSVTVFPVMLGMYLRTRSQSLALRIEKPLNIVALCFFLIIVIGIIVKEKARLVALLPSLGPTAFCLNVASMLAGYVLAQLFGLESRHRSTISIEVGLQNSATGIFIAAALLGRSDLGVFAAVYAVCMMVNVGLLTVIIKSLQIWKPSPVTSSAG